MRGLGSEVMLWSTLPYKKYVKRPGHREPETWYTRRADTHYPVGVLGLDSAPTNIKINVLQVMYREDAFKSPTSPYCFKTKAKRHSDHPNSGDSRSPQGCLIDSSP